MAKIVFGGGVSTMRGSEGGTTYSRNRYGNYTRQRTIPIQPRTSAQSIVRSLFGNNSTNWKALTQAQRDTFTTNAAGYVFYDSSGTAFTLSGQALYVALNQQLTALGLSPISSCPVAGTAPSVTADKPVADISADTFSIPNLASTSANNVIAIYATAQYSPGRNFFGKSAYKLIGKKAASGAAGAFDIKSMYASVFGASPAGMALDSKIGIMMKRVSTVNGQSSAFLKYIIQVQA